MTTPLLFVLLYLLFYLTQVSHLLNRLKISALNFENIYLLYKYQQLVTGVHFSRFYSIIEIYFSAFPFVLRLKRRPFPLLFSREGGAGG